MQKLVSYYVATEIRRLKKSISILGCGWLGMPLAIHLKQKGYRINASNTSGKNFERLKAVGIEPFIVDIERLGKDVRRFLSVEIVIISINSKNTGSIKNLISLIGDSQVKKLLFISSTSVYPDTNEIVTEEMPVKESPLSEIEELFIANKHFKSTILRFGGLFGYNRKPGSFYPKGRIIDNPEGFVNLIHRDDCIGIIDQIVSKDIWNETFNACADSHPTRRDFYTKEIAENGKFVAEFNEQSVSSYKIISSEKLKKMLAYTFKYPDLMNY